MLTKEDIIYSGQNSPRIVMAIALGIDGDVLITIPTFVDVYEMLTTSTSITCVDEECGTVEVHKDGEVVETLSLNDPFMGSVLASNPDILEIVRRNTDNSFPELTDEIRTNMSVIPGWTYNESGFVPPSGWVLPPARTESQLEAARRTLQEFRGE